MPALVCVCVCVCRVIYLYVLLNSPDLVNNYYTNSYTMFNRLSQGYCRGSTFNQNVQKSIDCISSRYITIIGNNRRENRWWVKLGFWRWGIRRWGSGDGDLEMGIWRWGSGDGNLEMGI